MSEIQLLEIQSDLYGFQDWSPATTCKLTTAHDTLSDWSFYRQWTPKQIIWLLTAEDTFTADWAYQYMTDETMLTGMGEWSDGTPVLPLLWHTNAIGDVPSFQDAVFEHILKDPFFLTMEEAHVSNDVKSLWKWIGGFCFPHSCVVFKHIGARPLWSRQRFKRRSTFQRPVLGNQRHGVVSTTLLILSAGLVALGLVLYFRSDGICSHGRGEAPT